MNVLIVDDDESNRENLSMLVSALGFETSCAESGFEALRLLAGEAPPDAVILDVMMPELDGVDTVRRYRSMGGRKPVIMCSALDEGETVVRAVRAGATDYITKPFDADELREILERVAGNSSHPRPAAPAPAGGSPDFGSSPAMRAVEELVTRIADADVPVLITGESGVGKDVVARAIHARSARADRVFIKINCAALPGELLESELFGHERGSFTGAQRTKPGQFELADGGTLFLDEIGEMPVSMQAKLLQALQDGEFYRIGGQRKIKVDTRVIVATNVDLARAMERGAFRDDLYYRLNVVRVAIPPLRERREDIPRLLQLFLEKYGRRYGRVPEIPQVVVEHFRSYDFPGNIRELENLVRRLMVLGDPSYVLSELRAASPVAVPTAPVAPVPMSMPVAGAPATSAAAYASPFYSPSPLPPPTIPPPPHYLSAQRIADQAGGAAAHQALVDEYRIDLKELGRRAAHAAEREAIILMLGHTGGNKREAAVRLGISYKAILYKIREFGIGRPRARLAPPVSSSAASSSPPSSSSLPSSSSSSSSSSPSSPSSPSSSPSSSLPAPAEVVG